MPTDQRYTEILRKSSHGLLEGDLDGMVIEDDDDEEDLSPIPKFPFKDFSVNTFAYFSWNLLTFAWMKPLLKLGNERPLEQKDLFVLPSSDKAQKIYSRFRELWLQELLKKTAPSINRETERGHGEPSLARAFVGAFGWPFLAAGFLKLIHDSCLFVGPMLLNSLINLLSDPSRSASDGYYYVLGLFLANFIMSLCLRQYFWLVIFTFLILLFACYYVSFSDCLLACH